MISKESLFSHFQTRKVDNIRILRYNPESKIEHLIKSGGGNGPVKPGNLRKRGVPNPAGTKDEVYFGTSAPSEDGAFCFSGEKTDKLPGRTARDVDVAAAYE